VSTDCYRQQPLALKQQAKIFNDKQSLKVIYTVKGKTEAPYVDTTLHSQDSLSIGNTASATKSFVEFL
jgi:hypothetical protein